MPPRCTKKPAAKTRRGEQPAKVLPLLFFSLTCVVLMVTVMATDQCPVNQASSTLASILDSPMSKAIKEMVKRLKSDKPKMENLLNNVSEIETLQVCSTCSGSEIQESEAQFSC